MKQNKNKSESVYETPDGNNKKISESTVIFILTSVIIILLIYLFGMKFVNRQNLEISEYYSAFSTELTEENTESQELTVNINSDDVFELMLLPGIGMSKAEAIIEYRKENGDFDDINELLDVPGIGDAVFEKLKSMIVIE